MQFNHVYQYLLNNVSFVISTYVCICFSTFEDGEAWYRVSTVELEVKARFQPFPFLLLWTDGNFFLHSFTPAIFATTKKEIWHANLCTLAT